MTGVCPHCGYALAKDEVLELGDWSIDPRGLLQFRGESIPLSASMFDMMHCIAKARGRIVSRDAILNFAGSRGDANTICVQFSRARRIMQERGIAFPIRAAKPRGYAWNMHSLFTETGYGSLTI